MKKDDSYTGALLENIRDQIVALSEITLETRRFVAPIPQMQADISELKADMKTVKRAVTNTSADLRLLERRVTKLEKAA